MFSEKFGKSLRAIFDRTAPDDYFLCLTVYIEKFFRTPLLQSTSGKGLFHVHVSEFQPADTLKNYFTGDFQAFYARTGSSYSKAFIYIKSLKIICEKLIYNEVARCQPASLRNKFFHTSSFMYFPCIFFEYITITSSEEPLKVCEHNFFQEI